MVRLVAVVALILRNCQGWRRRVKTRIFVSNLRAYFEDLAKSKDTSTAASTLVDSWAFSYISHTYLRPIMEAFDADGSGSITIFEVNDFMGTLPPTIDWRFVASGKYDNLYSWSFP